MNGMSGCRGRMRRAGGLAAAEQLETVNPHAAGPACLAIASDGAVSDEVRLSAAEQLAALTPSAWTRPGRG